MGTRWSYSWTIAAMLCAVAGCGRGNLWAVGPPPSDDDGGSQGGGGAGGGAGSSSGGQGQCAELSAPREIIGLAGGAGFRQDAPALALSSDAGDVVTLASQWRATEGPAQPAELRHASMTAWLMWPGDDIGPSFPADVGRGASFAISQAGGDRFALLMSDGADPSPPNGAFFGPAFRPGLADVSTLTVSDGEATRVMFLEPSGEMFLLGTERMGTNRQTMVAPAEVVGGGAAAIDKPVPIGCGSSLLAADAAPNGNGWWVASSSALSAPDPCEFSDPVGVASSVVLASISASGDATALGWIPAGLGVVDVEVVVANHGGWVVYIVDQPTFPIRAVRVSPAGQPLATIDIAPVSLASIAAVRLGEAMALAYVGSSKRIELQVFDETGAKVISTAIGTSDGVDNRVLGPLSLLASPTDDALIVAWVEEGTARRVRMTRFDCVR